MIFDRFTPQMLDFLAENHIRNSKDWYDGHKDECRRIVIQPFYDLVESMTPTMLDIDPMFEVTPYRCTARVRRDTRYTKNKDLYRDHLWITFRHPRKRLGSALCFYFEINQDFWGYGTGYYDMKSSVLEECRRMILNEDFYFKEAYRAVNGSDFELFGQDYKRIRYPDAPQEYQSWLQKKRFGVCCESDDFDPLFSGTFYDKMIKDIKTIQPFYSFLQKAEERAGANSRLEGVD